ncbi:hypothetical protein E2562_008536 [Oryza meyeriana var. granulata]|uniref:Uncharacterized protein n=1 Tax=Oryza meyeriana var. granulata TaxID=110450 RepID=A0A6G1C4W4_9ORYZ|nr:hypothetical protein E2562_008536 [Oryza meyeriana var. granulata]
MQRQRDRGGGIGIALLTRKEVVVDESSGLPRDDLGPLHAALSQPLPARNQPTATIRISSGSSQI